MDSVGSSQVPVHRDRIHKSSSAPLGPSNAFANWPLALPCYCSLLCALCLGQAEGMAEGRAQTLGHVKPWVMSQPGGLGAELWCPRAQCSPSALPLFCQSLLLPCAELGLSVMLSCPVSIWRL